MSKKSQQKVPLYEMVKRHIMDLIHDGDWHVGKRLPSENELVQDLSVSRMTVNRALRDLASEGRVHRISGSGTFVAEKRSHSHPLHIGDIAEEVISRGNRHTSSILVLEEVQAAADLTERFEIESPATLYHSLIVHSENHVPIQLEERYVLPAFAPDYLKVNYSTQTTYQYMMSQSAFHEAEQIVQAVMPDEFVQQCLEIPEGEPSLQLLRRTWVEGRVVTASNLQHPASRFQFIGRYIP
jgi:GntR family histidine utilization transcriptional repressor